MIIYDEETKDLVIPNGFEAKTKETMRLQGKSVIISDIETTITPDEGFDGLARVDVDATDIHRRAEEEGFERGQVHVRDLMEDLDVDQNGEYATENGYKKVTVNVPDKYDEGYEDGEAKGWEEGYAKGDLDGYNKGYSDGKVDGEVDGKEEGIRIGKEAQKAEDDAKITPSITFTENGEYEADYGFKKVIVDVQGVQPEPEVAALTLNSTYIPLNYIPSNRTKVVTKMRFNGAQNDLKMIFGVFSTGAAPSFCVWREKTGKISRQYNKLNGSTGYTLDVDTDVEIGYGKDGLIVDGVKIADNNTTVFNCDTPIYVGYESGYSNINWVGNTTFYSFKVYEDDVLVLDLVPEINASGYGCLKDTLTGTIYNAVDETKAIPVTESDYKRGYADGEEAQKAKLTNLTATENGTYEKEDGYKKVVVNVPQGIDTRIAGSVRVPAGRYICLEPTDGDWDYFHRNQRFEFEWTVLENSNAVLLEADEDYGVYLRWRENTLVLDTEFDDGMAVSIPFDDAVYPVKIKCIFDGYNAVNAYSKGSVIMEDAAGNFVTEKWDKLVYEAPDGTREFYMFGHDDDADRGWNDIDTIFGYLKIYDLNATTHIPERLTHYLRFSPAQNTIVDLVGNFEVVNTYVRQGAGEFTPLFD